MEYDFYKNEKNKVLSKNGFHGSDFNKNTSYMYIIVDLIKLYQ
jgi:hypothetical protein